ncbi:hypothetical protein MTO96_021861 [Rhipicephalus appendiculatus]
MDGGGDKKEKCRMRHGMERGSLASSVTTHKPCRLLSQHAKAEVQTEGCCTAIKSTLHQRDLQSSEFKEKLNTTPESQACEEHQLREKIELKTLSSPAPTARCSKSQ